MTDGELAHVAALIVVVLLLAALLALAVSIVREVAS